MSNLKRTKRPSGFTLVELLIVVIILAILAAIVIPQFNTSSNDAKVAALQSNLSVMRNAIELYRSQHGDFPGVKAATGGGTACTASPTSGAVGTGSAADDAGKVQAFKDQMTMYTDGTGKACSVGNETFKYGPYIRGKIPADPIYSKDDVAVLTAEPSAETGGWGYFPSTGRIILNSSGPATGTKYATY